jgi:DMSO/TMAO reductase YedYZ molybdopterin-dependent catalytic subunit
MNAFARRRALGVFAAGIALALALCAASPFAAYADDADDDQETTAGIADFTDRDTGLYPDVQENATYQNSGNRGCTSCHDNLFDLDKDNGTTTHITTYVGMKAANYTADCQTCHGIASALTGNLMAENIHVSHYSSEEFVEANGNCWSCHAMTYDEDGNYTMVLYEELQYEDSYGGYPDASLSEATQAWAAARGWTTGYMSGVSVVSSDDAELDVALDQAASEEDEEFLVLNYQHEDGDDAYSSIDADTWTLTVTGVNNPTTFTLDDLKALPQVTTTVGQWCAVNGINGASADNMPVQGVLLADLIEACGGLADGANAIYPEAIDGWAGATGISVQELIDANTLICYANYGHDLTVEQGGPAKLLVPGAKGAVSVKNLVGIDFAQTDEPSSIGSPINAINTSWFDNDGVEATVGEPVVLEGASYGDELATIEFSLDYGVTWTSVDVPEDFDPQQWVHYTLTWTPEEAGTYIVKARAIGADGTEQSSPSSLIVVVSE